MSMLVRLYAPNGTRTALDGVRKFCQEQGKPRRDRSAVAWYAGLRKRSDTSWCPAESDTSDMPLIGVISSNGCGCCDGGFKA